MYNRTWETVPWYMIRRRGRLRVQDSRFAFIGKIFTDEDVILIFCYQYVLRLSGFLVKVRFTRAVTHIRGQFTVVYESKDFSEVNWPTSVNRQTFSNFNWQIWVVVLKRTRAGLNGRHARLGAVANVGLATRRVGKILTFESRSLGSAFSTAFVIGQSIFFVTVFYAKEFYLVPRRHV